MKSHIKLPLTDRERTRLRKHQLKIAEITKYAPDELEVIMDVSPERASTLWALAEFQQIPSVGIKFAEDLVFLGFSGIDELKDKDGATLTDMYEKKKAVYFAQSKDLSKRWWDFTAARKKFRSLHGYPEDRPSLCWYDIAQKSNED